MKTLFLVRHAKSSRDDPSLPDRDRPLDDRGKRDAPTMGKRLAKRDVKPDLLLSSPALRALTTAQLMAEEVGYKRKEHRCRRSAVWQLSVSLQAVTFGLSFCHRRFREVALTRALRREHPLTRPSSGACPSPPFRPLQLA